MSEIENKYVLSSENNSSATISDNWIHFQCIKHIKQIELKQCWREGKLHYLFLYFFIFFCCYEIKLHLISINFIKCTSTWLHLNQYKYVTVDDKKSENQDT